MSKLEVIHFAEFVLISITVIYLAITAYNQMTDKDGYINTFSVLGALMSAIAAACMIVYFPPG